MTTKPVNRRAAPSRPTNLPLGRWLGDFPKLSGFEKKLVACCARGHVCVPDGWDDERPEQATVANTIRAGLIRFLALGGDEGNPVHELGVMLAGAWIVDKLDLHQARAAVRFSVENSYFVVRPVFVAATLSELTLSGSCIPGLDADGLMVSGGVILKEGFSATGKVRLLDAQIGGSLACGGGSFANAGGAALSADRMVVKGGVFLDEGFSATAEVRLLGAQIGGNLSCSGGSFANADGDALAADGMVVDGGVFLAEGFSATGAVRLLGAQIGGDLDCSGGSFANKNGKALSADILTVTGGLFLRSARVEGTITLTAAKIGTLVDDDQCWANGQHLLDGLAYDRIIGAADATMRIAWLNRQRKDQLTEDFKPQPWEQLIKVLREMGHPYEAGQVAIAKQQAFRKAGHIKGTTRQAAHWLYGALAGYGHRPSRTLWSMVMVCMVSSLFYYEGRHDGLFGPTNAVIQTQSTLAMCGDGGTPGRVHWTSPQCPMPPEYTTFQPFLYSLDLILPLVNLGQETDWAPIVTNESGATLWAGRGLRWLVWFEILFGWMASLMLVAVLGRLVDKD